MLLGARPYRSVRTQPGEPDMLRSASRALAAAAAATTHVRAVAVAAGVFWLFGGGGLIAHGRAPSHAVRLCLWLVCKRAVTVA